MNQMKDQNFKNSTQSSSDFTDDQTTTSLHLLPVYSPIYIYSKVRMKAYSLLVTFICCVCEYTSVDIMPEIKRNILNFGHGINFKYEGMLSHSFDRFYVVMKFVLPTIEDLKFSPVEFDSTCSYLYVDINGSKFLTQYLPNIKSFCKIFIAFIDFYKKKN